MVGAMLWVGIIVVHVISMGWVGTVLVDWSVVIKCLNVMVLNAVWGLALNHLPQIIVVVLKVAYQLLSMVLIDVMMVIMVGSFRYNIMMQISMVISTMSIEIYVVILSPIPHWSALISPIRPLSARVSRWSGIVWVFVWGHVASRWHVAILRPLF